MRILPALVVALLLLPAAPANASGKSDCISRPEIRRILWHGPTRAETEAMLGWEGRGESPRLRTYRACGQSWDSWVQLSYVNGYVFTVATFG